MHIISNYEAELLERMLIEDGIRMNTLDSETRNAIRRMKNDLFVSYEYRPQADSLSARLLYVRATPLAQDALRLFKQQAEQQIRMIESRERAAFGIEELASEVSVLQSHLQQTAQELCDYKTQQAEQYQADAAQAIIDKKKQRRHEYLVAAFTVALTLSIEHIADIVEVLKLAFKVIRSFFH